ncbi:MAG: hypothetical protein ACUVTG_04600 [Candidatus Oleimicrobiaceae bacterium]
MRARCERRRQRTATEGIPGRIGPGSHEPEVNHGRELLARKNPMLGSARLSTFGTQRVSCASPSGGALLDLGRYAL